MKIVVIGGSGLIDSKTVAILRQICRMNGQPDERAAKVAE